MAEQDSKASAEDGEYSAETMPTAAMDVGEDGGVDGEITEEGEEPAEEGKTHTGKGDRSGHSPPTSRDAGDKSGGGESKKHRSSSDRRRHHHHHHSSSSHRDHRRRRSGGHTSDGDAHGSGEDSHGGGRPRRRSESTGESQSEHNTDKSSRSSPRKHRDRRSSRTSSQHSSGHPQQQRSRQSLEESSDNGEWSESHEDPLGSMKDSVNMSRRHSREKRDSHRVPVGAEKGEAEDGEILEDGELDDDEEEVEGRGGEDGSKDSSTEVSPSKSSSKEEMKNDSKSERKKPDHKERRKRDSDDKKKRKKYTDVDNAEEESGPAPAWGSGYQGPKPKSSPFHKKQQQQQQGRYSRGGKGYQSPPGLYDSPSYSEDSEEEIPKGLMTEGYIDASVAADEKEGIFNQKTMLQKKKKRERNFERNDRKRGRMDGKFDGPPKKKPLVDLAMSERPVCKFYMEGKCAKGSGCQFNHDVEKPRKMEVCKYHLTVKGCHKEKCLYMHQDFPCKYYHTGAKCYSGDRCKFSHDPLTEDTRRALEMRVAAEDIVDMENPDYDYEYRPQREREFENRNRPSLLGSPPRYRPDMKKIPSLFEIEVRPPGQSPKPSPQAPRPSGFYNETNVSPKPGMGPNAGGGPMNSPNMGMMGQNNQQGHPNNQGPNMGGPGLLQPPMRGPNMMGGPMGNRPNMMGNQQGMNPQQQRPGGGPPVQFMGPGQMNNNQQQQQQQGGNLPPVLNMLGAIIREAAMQKGPGAPNNNNNNNNMNMGPNNMGPNNMGPGNMGPNNGMGPNNMRPNMNNMGPNMNMGPNNMRQGNMNNMGPNSNMAPNNMGPNNMGNMPPNSMGNMAPNSMGNMPPNSMGPMNMGQNMMGPNNMGQVNNMGPNSSMGNMGPNNMGNMGPPPSTMGPPTNVSNMGPNSNMGGNKMGVGQPNMGQEVGIMDVDYRIKRDYEEMEETSQDLTELDKIRRQLQEQIDKEDEGGEEEEGEEDGDEETKMQISEEQLSPERAGSSPTTEETKDEKAALKTEVEAELENLEIPAHLPKKQRELFKRIQQQQLLREKERERQEAQKLAEEAEAKAEVDDWYSSDEDGEDEKKPKLTDVLKKLSQEPSTSSKVVSTNSASSSTASGSLSTSTSSSTTTPSTASAFNIMQMINAIKSQTVATTGTTATKPATDILGAITSLATTKLSSSIALDPRQQKASLASSPASPPSSSSAKQPDASGLHHPSMPSLHLPALTVDPPVVSARPMKPLVYGVVKILLSTAKPYTQLPNDVNASDPAFKNDPRVRWHLQYLEKQMAKEQQRRNSMDNEKPQKPADPRLKKAGAGDPRLAKAGDSPSSGQGDGAQVSDPRLQRGAAAAAPSRPADPRLARQAAGALDPRLNRQNSQSSQDSSNFMGGPMNNMGGMMGNQMGGPMGSMGGPMNNQMGGPMSNPMGGPMNNPMGGPMNNMGPMGNMGGPMNNQMGGPMNNQMGGPMNPQMGGPMNQMGGMNNMGGGPGRQMQGGGPMNNMGPMGNNMNMMGGAMNNMGGGMNQMGSPGLMGPGPNQMNRMGGPQGNNMGGPGNSNMMGSGPMGNMMRGPMGQQNPMNTDSVMMDPRMNNNPADPRMGGQRQANVNDPRGGSDPRLRNKSMDPREQRMTAKTGRDPRSMSSISSPNDDGLNDPRTSDYSSDQGSFQSNIRGQNDFRSSPNDYLSNDSASFGAPGQFKMGRDNWPQDLGSRRQEPDSSLPPLSATSTMQSPSTQDSENDAQKTSRKFDHRNDPRFKRVKRIGGERKGSMEYSSPLGGEDGQGGSDDGADTGYSSYNRPKLSARDPRARNTPSPSLPDTLQDFELPPLTVSEPEPDLKVKDLFKTIDPTASPFC